MTANSRSARDYRVAPYAGWAPQEEGLIVARGTWLATVSTESARRLRDDLLAADGPITASEQTQGLLVQLADRGIVRPGGERTSSHRALREAQAPDPGGSARNEIPVASGGITVLGQGELADALADLLAGELGQEPVEVRRETALAPDIAAEPALIVAASGHGDELTELNRRCQAETIPWILVDVRTSGPLIVGPLFVPPRTACLECYWRRRAACFRRPESCEALLRSGRSGAGGAWQRHMAAGVACAMTLGWVLAADPWLPGACFEIGATGGPRLRRHHTLPVRGCVVCDEPDLDESPDDGE